MIHKHKSEVKKRVWIAVFSMLLVAFSFTPNTAHAALTDGLVGYWTFDGNDTMLK